RVSCFCMSATRSPATGSTAPSSEAPRPRSTAQMRSLPKRPITCAPSWRRSAAEMTDVKVVNIIPASHSSETNQDSEPSIAVNPQNPSQIAITAFTPPDPGLLNSPFYSSLGGGFTWHLNFAMPYGQNAPGLQFPGDQSIAFSSDGNELFGAFLRHDNQNLQVFRTNDVTAPA